MKKKTKKSNIGIETFFFIFMAFLMIAIIVFGINKLFYVHKQLSTQERISIEHRIRTDLNFCSDPLNKGSFKSDIIKNQIFNGIIIIGKNLNHCGLNFSQKRELKILNETNNSLVLIKTFFSNSGNMIILTNFQIIDSFHFTYHSTSSICWYDKTNSGKLTLNISCN